MELKDLLLNLRMIMFGGKGGVGKTTCSASSAIWAAEHGRKTLIISTDPAHSLGDSLGVELAPGVPTKIEGIPNLTALEINPREKIADFQKFTQFNPLKEIGLPDFMQDNSLMGDMGDLQDLANMSPPGIDEALAFAKVLEFIETEHDYDLVIFDTAPTGHTLRFLSLPETLSGWIGKLLRWRVKVGNIFGVFKNIFSKEEKKKDNTLEFLEKMNRIILNAREDLMDPTINNFVIVMIPEEMAIAETGRLINELLKYRIPSSCIVVNQVYENTEDLCDFCRSRRAMQQKNLKKIREIFHEKLGRKIIEVPLFKEEIRTPEQLREFSKYLLS